MARKLRVEYPAAINHMMSRGDRREPIFKDDLDRRRFLEPLAEACAKAGWQVRAHGLMGDHHGGPWRCFVESARGRSAKPIPKPGANGGDRLAYIDIFAWACRHEVRHVQNYGAWWPQCYDAQDDPDTDNILSAVELTLAYNGVPYSPTNACTHSVYCGPGEGDDQLFTSLTAEVWRQEDQDASFKDDWAKPGKNWPEEP